MIELYFAPGACSFVAHVALQRIKAVTGYEFQAKLIKLHKNEQNSPAYLALNPNGQVPTIVINGMAVTQIVAICDLLDRSFPEASILPQPSETRTRALSHLAWMNTSAHSTFNRCFRPDRFAKSEAAQGEVRELALEQFRAQLARLEALATIAEPFWLGAHLTCLDTYALTLFRWGGLAGIDPSSLPRYFSYVARVAAEPSVATVMARERTWLDTFTPANRGDGR